jgi:nucleoside-diphosphate-sugar epimerase
MIKVGIVGANGQVGAELCLLLAARGGIEMVAICRNQSGSAFLRWQGIACRHGRVADPAEASRLLGDCDFVVNSSLATGTPAQIRRIEAAIVRNLFLHSKAGAAVIHFSTQSVYGDPRPNRWIRWRNPYGRAKLATERCVRTESSRTGKRAYILRLGHVCGGLQEISQTIRAAIRARSVLLPAENRSSNTTYTQAIIGALVQVITGKTEPGTYDLMNSPRWTWNEVYEFEAAACRLPLNAQYVEPAPRSRPPSMAAALLRFTRNMAGKPAVREAFAKLFAHAPDSLNARAMAWWYKRRAAAEIASLRVRAPVAEHLFWVANGVNFFPADTPTIDLLHATPPQSSTATGPNSWPADLPDSSCANAVDRNHVSRHVAAD